jgi:molybdopterin converting factor small subunit
MDRGGAPSARRALGRNRRVVTVRLPGLLADQAGGRKEFDVEAASVRTALQALPVRDLLFDERGELRQLVNVYVDRTDARDRGGLDAELSGGETIRVVAAIAGG